MDQLSRLFGEWLKDLVPGISDITRVIKERIIYRSAEEKSKRPLKGFKGDEMEIDINSFCNPIEDYEKPKKDIMSLEQIEEIKFLEDLMEKGMSLDE